MLNRYKFGNPAHRRDSLIVEIKKLIKKEIYGSMSSMGALEQERYFFGHVNSPEHMLTHIVLADDDLSNMQEGSSTATTTGGPATGYSPPITTSGP